jgi:hypothetical protein
LTGDSVRYARNPDFIYRQIADGTVLVPIRRQVADMECLYTLSPVAASVWQQLEQPATAAELHAALLDEYEVEAEVLAADLERFLGEMIEIDALRKV